MSKQYHIRWSAADERELARVVKNYNAKVRRIEKKNASKNKIVLPETITVGQLKELINTRKDLNREMNKLKRFSKRGAETLVEVPNNDNNLLMTKWQRTEMNRETAIINRRREQRLKKVSEIEQKSGGESLGYTKAQIGMGSPELVALRPMKAFTRTMGPQDIRERWKSIHAQVQSDYFTKRDLQVRENYIKGLIRNYNYDDIQPIVKKIRDMDINEFLITFNEEGATFEEVSPPPGLIGQELKEREYSAYVTKLYSTWLPNE